MRCTSDLGLIQCIIGFMNDESREPTITYIRDSDVDLVLDAKLRALLVACFPHEEKFKAQRYANEKPAHRFFIFDGAEIAAHIAVHEKEILIDNKEYLAGGIAEVMVCDKYRGLSYAKRLLTAIDKFFYEREISLLILFGKPEIYKSSGYSSLSNIFRYFDLEQDCIVSEKIAYGMGKSLDGTDFPSGDIDLRGPLF